MIGSTIIASVGFGLVFEYGRFYERNLMHEENVSSSSSSSSGSTLTTKDPSSDTDDTVDKDRPVFKYSTRLKVNTAIWFMILLSVEYLLMPRKWNPFTYTKNQSQQAGSDDAAQWRFSHHLLALKVFTSWSLMLVVGFGLLIVVYRSLRHARIVLNEQRQSLQQQKQQLLGKFEQQEETVETVEAGSSSNEEVSAQNDVTEDDDSDDAVKVDELDGDTGALSSVLLETVQALPRPDTPPAVWTDEMQKDSGLAQQAIEDRWKSLQGRNDQLEQLRHLKQQQEHRLKILRARRQQNQLEKDQKERKQQKQEKKNEENDRIIVANEKLLKSIVARQEAEIVQTLERVASEASDTVNDDHPHHGTHDDSGKNPDGHDDDKSEDDRLAEERDKLRRLTDELEALKVDMQDYREECQRQQEQKIEDLERRQKELDDREQHLGKERETLAAVIANASVPVKNDEKQPEQLQVAQSDDVSEQQKSLPTSSSTGVELVDDEDASGVVVVDVKTAKKDTDSSTLDDVPFVGDAVDDDTATFCSSRSNDEEEEYKKEEVFVAPAPEESLKTVPAVFQDEAPVASTAAPDVADETAFKSDVSHLDAVVEPVEAISRAASTALSTTTEDQEKFESASAVTAVVGHISQPPLLPPQPPSASKLLPDGPSGILTQRRRPTPIWTMDPSQIAAAAAGDGDAMSLPGGIDARGCDDSDIASGLMNLFRAW